MASFNYGLLDQAEEDNVHQSRLLSVEARPFQRITGRLLKPDSLINEPAHLPTPPPDADSASEAAASAQALVQKQAEERRIWREECTLDFEAYESSIVRIQLLHNSNERERERYADEKVKILATAQSIRDNTAELRVQLEAAQRTKAQRLRWDELAEKITSNKALRPREDQLPALQKLEEEIADLEQESRDYARTWTERREQFGRIVEEGRQMLRLIRDEKEEAERKEGMEGHEDGEDGEGSTTRGEISHAGTPRPEAGAMTPLHQSQEREGSPPKSNLQNEMLAPPVTPGRSSASNIASPARSSGPGDEIHDTEMQDSGITSRDAGDAQDDDEGEIEDGEAKEDGEEDEPGETMDVT